MSTVWVYFSVVYTGIWVRMQREISSGSCAPRFTRRQTRMSAPRSPGASLGRCCRSLLSPKRQDHNYISYCHYLSVSSLAPLTSPFFREARPCSFTAEWCGPFLSASVHRDTQWNEDMSAEENYNVCSCKTCLKSWTVDIQLVAHQPLVLS